MTKFNEIVEDVTKIDKNLLTSFKLKDTLNTKLWDGDKLNTTVRNNLVKIAYNFFKSLELEVDQPIKIWDIVLTGSMANYNWSEYSDLDVHIKLDFKDINVDEVLVKKMFDLARWKWNDIHDIDIYDIPVELYVEDVDEDHTSSGLYSLAKDKWISIPPKDKFKIDISDIKSKANSYMGVIPYLEKLKNDEDYIKIIQTVDIVIEKLKKMRKIGLSTDGEFSVENLAFKILRRNNFIGEILELKNFAYDKSLSL